MQIELAVPESQHWFSQPPICSACTLFSSHIPLFFLRAQAVIHGASGNSLLGNVGTKSIQGLPSSAIPSELCTGHPLSPGAKVLASKATLHTAIYSDLWAYHYWLLLSRHVCEPLCMKKLLAYAPQVGLSLYQFADGLTSRCWPDWHTSSHHPMQLLFMGLKKGKKSFSLLELKLLIVKTNFLVTANSRNLTLNICKSITKRLSADRYIQLSCVSPSLCQCWLNSVILLIFSSVLTSSGVSPFSYLI